MLLRRALFCLAALLLIAGPASWAQQAPTSAADSSAKAKPESAQSSPRRATRQTGASHASPVQGNKSRHSAAHARPVVLPIPPVPPAAPTPTEEAAKPKPPPFDPNKGSVTGLPLPRFAALRADVVNLRAGPGTRYPIDWIYKRVGMPVEILREFDVWRLVETPDGTKGWMHEATLTGRRDFIVTGGRQTLRAGDNDTSRAVAVVEPGVIGHIRRCEASAAWCRVQVGSYLGWLPREAMWGLLPKETVNP